MCWKHLALVLVLFGRARASDEACAAGDEVAQLQLSSSPGQQPPCLPPKSSLLASVLAQHATLKVESSDGGESTGSLTLTGKSVDKVRIFTERPLRKANTIPMSSFVHSFTKAFSKQSGGYPNAALAGSMARHEEELMQVTIVLKSASYHPEKVVFKWSSDDDTIRENIEFVSASLFIDSFWEDLRHPEEYVEHEICEHLISTIEEQGLDSVSCLAEDLSGLGICAAIDVEDAELLTLPCEGAVVEVCRVVVEHITNAVASEISKGQVTKTAACASAGYPAPS